MNEQDDMEESSSRIRPSRAKRPSPTNEQDDMEETPSRAAHRAAWNKYDQATKAALEKLRAAQKDADIIYTKDVRIASDILFKEIELEEEEKNRLAVAIAMFGYP